jgi:hypothetical protein
MRDLAVPYRRTYKYECSGGTLSVDGGVLPAGFSFSDDTLTYTPSTAPITYGTFRLKATANDGSGKTNVINITYYPVESIAKDSCVLLNTDGSVLSQELTIKDSNTLTLSPVSDIDNPFNNSIKAVYFCPNLSNITILDDLFLYKCAALTSVDLTPLTNVTTIGNCFLSECLALTAVDLSPLAKVTTIGGMFFGGCTALTSVDLSKLTKVTTIGFDFFDECSALTSANLPRLFDGATIGNDFLADCIALASVDLSPLAKAVSIGNNFLVGCWALTSIDLSPLANLATNGETPGIGS